MRNIVRNLVKAYHWEIIADDKEHLAANLPVRDGFEYPVEFSAWDDEDGRGILLRLYAVVSGDDEVALGSFLETIQPDGIHAECDSYDGSMYETFVAVNENTEERLRMMLKFMNDTLEICQNLRKHKLSWDDAAKEYQKRASKSI